MDRFSASLAAGPRAIRLSSPSRRAQLAAGSLLALAIALAAGWSSSGGPVAQVGRSSGGAAASLPLSARGPVSAALGAAQPGYLIGSAPGGFRARSAGAHLQARFGRFGVSLSSAGIDAHLRLRALSEGRSSLRLAPVAPTARGNRVTYVRPAVSEWYANGPLGLEQGFTISRAPSRGAGPLTLSMSLSGASSQRLSADAQSVVLSEGRSSLRYGALAATDASGRALHSWLALDDGQLLLRVDVAGARYPIAIDPLIQQGTSLAAAEVEGEAHFGGSVALSQDGSTALVGGARDANHHGAVWVFVRSGASWVQQGPKLTSGELETGGAGECGEEEAGEEPSECAFGSSVALSADGNTALIGAPAPGGATRHGMAWIFTRSGSSWTASALLSGGSGGREAGFGRSVALSGDGTTALVGNPTAADERGAAWVFTGSGTSWSTQASLLDAEGSRFARFGRSVALSGDGSTALIGGPEDGAYVGGAWLFSRVEGNWTQLPGRLTGRAESGEGHFGKSVALSADGRTALVGGPADSGGRGAAWPFAIAGRSFSQQGEELLEAGEPQEGQLRFGASVALSGDGDAALVGAPKAEGGIGTVTPFTRSGGAWTKDPEQLAGAEASGKASSGAGVALSADGMVALVGAPTQSAKVGAAWIFAEEPFAPPPAVGAVSPTHGPTAGGTTLTISGSNFTQATSVMIGGQPATSFTIKSATTIKALTPAEPEGTVDVTVGTPGGTSPRSPADQFTFEAPGSSKKGGQPPAETTTGASPTGSVVDPGAGASGGSGTPAIGALGFSGSAGLACHVALRSRHLAVAGRKSAAIRLLRTGTGACSGRVTLEYRYRLSKKRYRLRSIGSGSFAIPAGASRVVRIKLTRAGRALFRSHHGKLNASLAIVRLVPGPRLARTSSVRLSVQARHRAATVRS